MHWKDAQAILILSAMDPLDKVIEAAADDLDKPHLDCYCAMEISVGTHSSSGTDDVTSTVVDLETGRRILEAARKIIAQRRIELGISTNQDRVLIEAERGLAPPEVAAEEMQRRLHEAGEPCSAPKPTNAPIVHIDPLHPEVQVMAPALYPKRDAAIEEFARTHLRPAPESVIRSRTMWLVWKSMTGGQTGRNIFSQRLGIALRERGVAVVAAREGGGHKTWYGVAFSDEALAAAHKINRAVTGLEESRAVEAMGADARVTANAKERLNGE